MHSVPLEFFVAASALKTTALRTYIPQIIAEADGKPMCVFEKQMGMLTSKPPAMQRTLRRGETREQSVGLGDFPCARKLTLSFSRPTRLHGASHHSYGVTLPSWP